MHANTVANLTDLNDGFALLIGRFRTFFRGISLGATLSRFIRRTDMKKILMQLFRCTCQLRNSCQSGRHVLQRNDPDVAEGRDIWFN